MKHGSRASGQAARRVLLACALMNARRSCPAIWPWLGVSVGEMKMTKGIDGNNKMKRPKNVEQEATRRMANAPRSPPPDLERLLRERQESLRDRLEPPPPPDDRGVTVHGGFQFERNPTAIWWRLLGVFSGGFVLGLAVGKYLL
jgi:hypothetical protein